MKIMTITIAMMMNKKSSRTLFCSHSIIIFFVLSFLPALSFFSRFFYLLVLLKRSGVRSLNLHASGVYSNAGEELPADFGRKMLEIHGTYKQYSSPELS
jgi:hypothetical protein